jgi:hypothetical protein
MRWFAAFCLGPTCIFYIVISVLTVMNLVISSGNDMQLPADECERFTVMNGACVVTSVARSPDARTCSSFVNCSNFSAELRVPCPLPSGPYAYPSSTCPVVGAVTRLWFRNGVASLSEPPAQDSLVSLLRARLQRVFNIQIGATVAVAVGLLPLSVVFGAAVQYVRGVVPPATVSDSASSL